MCPCRGHSPGATRGWAVGFALGLKKGGGATPMLAGEAPELPVAEQGEIVDSRSPM